MQIFAGTAHSVGRFLRPWWRELLTVSILAAIGCAGQPNDPLFAIFMGAVGGVFWAMGYFHRQTPLRKQVTEVQGTLSEVHTILMEQDVQDDPDVPVHHRPPLYVVPS